MVSARRIWLIGGTQESAQIAREFAAKSISCIVTVTTENARSLYPPTLPIRVGKLAPADLKMFLMEHFVSGIVDASHPFAVEISKLAIAIAAEFSLPYLRFERSEVASGENAFPSFEALLATDLLVEERVLLTIGYRSLALFTQWHDRTSLFARILPSIEALNAALAAGFMSDRLIALRPPISAELEAALWRQWQITAVVTKASGSPGGEDVKRQVAAALGVKLVTIDRPTIFYPQQTSDLQTVLQFCQSCLGLPPKSPNIGGL
ncbi:MAG: cobalt-precorrin-6A reductase [Microcoleus sp. SIO2G3]|nr:cobalt-precorrin-6A reductase [Microcoleus sp. SIO2G3]